MKYQFFLHASFYLQKCLFKLPADAKLSVKTGTDDLLLCQKTGPFVLLAEPDKDCTWTTPLVTLSIEYGSTAPDAALEKLIEIQKAE